MNDDRDDVHWWAAPLGAGVVAMLFVCLALVAAGGWAWFAKFLEGTASGWAQAIGGVLAVVGAYKIGNRQVAAGRALEDYRRMQDELRRIATVDALLSNALGLCIAFRDTWDKSELGIPPDMPVAYIEDCIRLLQGVDPFDCPAPDVVIHIAQLPRQLAHFATSYTAYLQQLNGGGLERTFEQGLALRSELAATVGMLNDARRECSDASAKVAGIAP